VVADRTNGSQKGSARSREDGRALARDRQQRKEDCPYLCEKEVVCTFDWEAHDDCWNLKYFKCPHYYRETRVRGDVLSSRRFVKYESTVYSPLPEETNNIIRKLKLYPRRKCSRLCPSWRDCRGFDLSS